MFGRRRDRRGSLGRPAIEGETCTCGKPAVVVFEARRLGLALGSCMELDACERTGPCPFCGVSGPHRTGGVCPAYTLRPAWAAEAARNARRVSDVEGVLSA